jgi:hypothetical protein
LATFRQAEAGSGRLEKRNKNLDWRHLMMRWTTWWDQTCLGLGGSSSATSSLNWGRVQVPILTGEKNHSGKLPSKPLHWDFMIRYGCTYIIHLLLVWAWHYLWLWQVLTLWSQVSGGTITKSSTW